MYCKVPSWRAFSTADLRIAGSVTDEDARKTHPQGWKSPRPYIRIVPQPRT
jgi:hypothetical protein